MPEVATGLVQIERRDGGWVRLIINRPPANVLTMAVCRDIEQALTEACANPDTKLVSIEGAGSNFSYGASVDEHTPDKVQAMLPAFHQLIAALLSAPCLTAAIVRGRCLGGGLEVVLACDLVFASTDAKLGVPEIVLGVFPPAASALLPLRVGASRASRAVLSGEALPVSWWEAAGLTTTVTSATDLDHNVRHWFDTFAAPRSAVALRHAAVAARSVLREQAVAALQRLERQYLDELMTTHDAAEGCAAFLDKRPPLWRNR